MLLICCIIGIVFSGVLVYTYYAGDEVYDGLKEIEVNSISNKKKILEGDKALNEALVEIQEFETKTLVMMRKVREVNTTFQDWRIIVSREAALGENFFKQEQYIKLTKKIETILKEEKEKNYYKENDNYQQFIENAFFNYEKLKKESLSVFNTYKDNEAWEDMQPITINQLVEFNTKCIEATTETLAFVKLFSEELNKEIDKVKNHIQDAANLQKKVRVNTEEKIVEFSNHLTNKFLQNTKIVLIQFVISLFISCLLLFILSRIITTNLSELQKGLIEFFEYLQQKKEDCTSLKVSGEDEFAQMNHMINENVKLIKEGKIKDEEVIAEVNEIINYSKEGIIEKFSGVVDILSKFTKGNFDAPNEMATKTYGIIGIILRQLNTVGFNTSEILATNKTNGEEIKNSNQELVNNAEYLSSLANEQATELEETAAAIEEVTEAIKANSNSSLEMKNKGEILKSVSIKGKELATNTVASMQEINEKVTSISEVIQVIDNIAFQTNILSLNAAVEAATAGESGKGFAVVAQEVRNLANRSAEAAKDIKELVEKATAETSLGKANADQMIEGYGELSTEIEDTIAMINDVAHSTAEQGEAMNQINNAVNSLDKKTQQNAQVASQVKSKSAECLTISDEFIRVAEKTTFKKEALNIKTNVDLTFKINNLISEHLSYTQKVNKMVCGREEFDEDKIQKCNLHIFIGEMEEEKNKIIDTDYWGDFKASHNKVHDIGFRCTKAEYKSVEQAKLLKELSVTVGDTIQHLRKLQTTQF
jgi:methyl-accepting chemotaxis protein